MSSQRYILSGPAAIIGPLRPVLDRDPTVHLIHQRPERLIVEMSPARAAQLAAALGAAVTVEPDNLVPPPTPATP